MPTFPETHRDLLQTDTAILSTIGTDGFPQVTALWFLFDDDNTLKLSLNTTRQKTKNLQAHPECTLFILDRANPARTLEVRARAEVIPDDEYVFAEKFGRKYGGVNLRAIDPPDQTRVMIILHPVKINAIDMSRS